MEGYREVYFLQFIQELFYSDAKRQNTNLYPEELQGSTPVKMLLKACDESCKRNQVYLIIDNDTSLIMQATSEDLTEVIKKLKDCWGIQETKIAHGISMNELSKLNIYNKKPIIIASEPINMDGLIIQIFDKPLPDLSEQQNSKIDKIKLKSKCDSILGISKNANKEEKEQQTMDFYRSKLTKDKIEEKAKIHLCLQKMIDIFK